MGHLNGIVKNKFRPVILIMLGDKQIPDLPAANPRHNLTCDNKAVAHGNYTVRQSCQSGIVSNDYKGLVKLIP